MPIACLLLSTCRWTTEPVDLVSCLTLETSFYTKDQLNVFVFCVLHCHNNLLACMSYSYTTCWLILATILYIDYTGCIKKSVPNGKLPLHRIFRKIGCFLQPRVIRSLLVYLGWKIIFPSKFMLPGGFFLSSNFEMACAQKFNPENGIFLNRL